MKRAIGSFMLLLIGAGVNVRLAIPAPPLTVLTSTLTLTSANNGQTFDHYRISAATGDCVDLNGASNVTVQNSNIGPCAGRGVHIDGGSGNSIFDSYIHVEKLASGCCDTHNGVLVSGSTRDTIEGNVIAYGESNLQTASSSYIVINGNFLLNPQGPFPRGQQIQTAGGSNITVTNNLAVSTPDATLGPAIGTGNTAAILYGQDSSGGRPSDSINFYQTQTVHAENNYITGGLDASTPGSGGSQDASGCGMITDGSNTLVTNSATFKNNILVNTGQCGIGIGSGTNHTVVGNKTINLNANKGGDTADYIWNQYTPPCGSVLLNGNIASEIKLAPGGYASGYWNGGGCAPVTCDGTNTDIDSCNIFDYGTARVAYNLLTPVAAKLPPPLIPPVPKNCVVKSPYSTQTSVPSC